MQPEDLRKQLEYFRDLGIDQIYKREANSAAKGEPKGEIILPSMAPVNDSLAMISADIGDCRRCRLHVARKKIVFGSGDEKARLVFVGEGPGADEDEQGIPFVGRARTAPHPDDRWHRKEREHSPSPAPTFISAMW